MAVLPIVHLLSLAALDALSCLPFLKVRLLRVAVRFAYICVWWHMQHQIGQMFDGFRADRSFLLFFEKKEWMRLAAESI